MKGNSSINRRTFLKGLGTAIAMPMLESLMPARGWTASTAGAPAPVRMAFLFVPNGANMAHWTPSAEGADFELPSILEQLAPFQGDLLVLSGLTHDKGRPNGDGPGDHARSAGVFLTAAQPLKSEGAEIRAGVSVDQVAAKAMGRQTRFASLELGTEEGRQSGKCDSGYSCAYSNNISWRDAATPMTKETNPRQVFERLFGNNVPGEVDASQAQRLRHRKSILDFVLEDAQRLSARVDGADRRKIQEYLAAVREIEQRIEGAERETTTSEAMLAGYNPPAGIPPSYEEHIRLMSDMLVLAFQTDVTRIATFMFANAGSNKSYPFIGVPEGHHDLSHHGDDKDKLAKITQINRFHIAQLAYLLQRLKSTPDGEGTLLDQCMIVYGSGISDGNRHNHDNLPVLLAGRGGGSLQPGRHIRYEAETPMANLFVSMLNRMGVQTDSFGDSKGRLKYLEGSIPGIGSDPRRI